MKAPSSAGAPPPAGEAEVDPTRLAWRVRVDGALDGALNMARDQALAEAVEPGAAVLRLYRWDLPTVSFGRNEPASGLYDLDAARRAGIAFVRRPTGGRAVLHHRELTYAVVAPLRALGGAREAYRLVNRALVRGLASLGVPAEIAESPGRAAALDAGPCFRLPADGEVVSGGRKLIGSAQARIGGALLQHGSILVADDQGLVEGLRLKPGDRGEPPATVLERLGREPDPAALVEAVLGGFRASMPGDWSADPERGSVAGEARILRERYAFDAWTWRR